MALTNYTELKTEVANWIHRTNLELQIPGFITLAETYMNNDLRLRSMIATEDIPISTSVKTAALPDRYLEVISFNDDFGDQMQQVNTDQLQQMSYEAGNARPEFFAITDEILFERKGDVSYNFPMTFYKALDIETDTTNAVLTKYPTIYLYGTLIIAETYVLNEERAATWNALYQAALDSAIKREQKSLKRLRSEHPSVQRSFNIYRGY